MGLIYPTEAVTEPSRVGPVPLNSDWFFQVRILTDAVDDITTVDDFLAVSENHILEDVNDCVAALQVGAEEVQCDQNIWSIYRGSFLKALPDYEIRNRQIARRSYHKFPRILPIRT